MNETYLYPYSAKEARERNELSLWRESHRANIACREAIEDTIRRSFDGMHLDKDCITPVLDEYGYKRTAWVLANTLHELKWDGRFSPANKQWAEKIYIPTDLIHNSDFVVRSHPAVLDGFVSLYRKAVQALNLFGAEHCVGDRAEQDFTGKVLVLSPDTLKESCWSQADQLWYARSGFGCELTPVVEQSLPPASRTVKQPDGIGRIHRCAGRKIPAGLGAGEAHGADRTPAGGTGRR